MFRERANNPTLNRENQSCEMKLRKRKDMAILKSAEYASRGDFCRIFDQQMNSLYLLSFLLTADREKAEQCFVSGLEDSLGGNRVFKEWAHAWARRTIIKNAVRVIEPRPTDRLTKLIPIDPPIDRNYNSQRPDGSELSAILSLGPFERFVFVMSILEHYSDQDCSLLLGCTRRDVVAGRISALTRVAATTAECGAARFAPQLLGASA